MANIFLASDHHLSHKNVITFLRPDGTKLRDFSSIEEHDEFIITQHNSVVKACDKVYFLGDVTFSNKYLPLLNRMNGTKVLIKGNHDVLKVSQYMEYFKDIRATHNLDRMVLSHVPVHSACLDRWKANIHGHLHDRQVLLADGTRDTKYFSVCMEQLDNYTPISLEEVKSRLE